MRLRKDEKKIAEHAIKQEYGYTEENEDEDEDVKVDRIGPVAHPSDKVLDSIIARCEDLQRSKA